MSKFLLVIHGAMGAGKTVTATGLHEQLPRNAHVVQTDIKKMISGYVPGEQIAGIPVITQNLVESFLIQGISVIAECVSNDAGLEMYKQIAEKTKAECYVFRLDAPVEVRWQRVCDRTKEMMHVDELSKTKLQELENIFTPNTHFYESLDTALDQIIDTSEHSAEAVIAKISDRMKGV